VLTHESLVLNPLDTVSLLETSFLAGEALASHAEEFFCIC